MGAVGELHEPLRPSGGEGELRESPEGPEQDRSGAPFVRLRELEGLNRADEVLYRSLQLDEVLQALVDVVTDILQADKCAVSVWDEDRQRLVVRATSGFAPETLANMTYAPGEGVNGKVLETGEPVAVPDYDAWEDRIPGFDGGAVKAVLGVPIRIGGQVFGTFGVNYCRPRSFGEDEIRLFQSLAQRAALAIENARLHEQAQRLAAVEERQRLARELHDSVSQALFGIVLGAKTARALVDRDPVRVIEPLDYILSLAEAGLAEMRALIFELRPETLENEGLVAALTKQVEALRARHGIALNSDLMEEPPLKLRAKEALYRIAQEAMNNVIRHAGASLLELRLVAEDGSVVLEVRDDGRGFDPAGEFPGHLGLKSMRERLGKVGGTLQIDSQPGLGTTIRASLDTLQRGH